MLRIGRRKNVDYWSAHCYALADGKNVKQVIFVVREEDGIVRHTLPLQKKAKAKNPHSLLLLLLIEDWTKNIAKYVCMSVNHYIIFIIVIKDIFKCIRRVSKKAVINLITDLILFIYLIHTMQLHNKNLRDFWIAY